MVCNKYLCAVCSKGGHKNLPTLRNFKSKTNFKNQVSKAKALAHTRHVAVERVAERANVAKVQVDVVVAASAVGRRRPSVAQRPPQIEQRRITSTHTRGIWIRG